jgi:cell volume regulation protein A
MPLPDGSAVILVIRNDELIAPNGSTVLARDDHVYVACHPEDESLSHMSFALLERIRKLRTGWRREFKLSGDLLNE